MNDFHPQWISSRGPARCHQCAGPGRHKYEQQRKPPDCLLVVALKCRHRESCPGTARDTLCWSEHFKTHCCTTQFTRCPTGVKWSQVQILSARPRSRRSKVVWELDVKLFGRFLDDGDLEDGAGD